MLLESVVGDPLTFPLEPFTILPTAKIHIHAPKRINPLHFGHFYDTKPCHKITVKHIKQIIALYTSLS